MTKLHKILPVRLNHQLCNSKTSADLLLENQKYEIAKQKSKHIIPHDKEQQIKKTTKSIFATFYHKFIVYHVFIFANNAPAHKIKWNERFLSDVFLSPNQYIWIVLWLKWPFANSHYWRHAKKKHYSASKSRLVHSQTMTSEASFSFKSFNVCSIPCVLCPTQVWW